MYVCNTYLYLTQQKSASRSTPLLPEEYLHGKCSWRDSYLISFAFGPKILGTVILCTYVRTSQKHQSTFSRLDETHHCYQPYRSLTFRSWPDPEGRYMQSFSPHHHYQALKTSD